MIFKYEQVIPETEDHILHRYFEKVRKEILPNHDCRWIDTGYSIAVTMKGRTTIFITLSGKPDMTDFSFLDFDSVLMEGIP